MDSIIINNNKYEVNETKEKELDVEEDDIEVCLTYCTCFGNQFHEIFDRKYNAPNVNSTFEN